MVAAADDDLERPPSQDDVVAALRDLVLVDLDASNEASVSNAQSNTVVRDAKQLTNDARAAMDQTHLGLQNLLYERRHLEREIAKYRQFRAIYQDIELQSVEDFFQLSPPEARSEDIFDNPHKLMIQRLSFELHERVRLAEKLRELESEKSELEARIKVQQNTSQKFSAEADKLTKGILELQSKMHDFGRNIPTKAETPKTIAQK